MLFYGLILMHKILTNIALKFTGLFLYRKLAVPYKAWSYVKVEMLGFFFANLLRC
jgi:hypothetical protein